jgi:hypothetical protein
VGSLGSIAALGEPVATTSAIERSGKVEKEGLDVSDSFQCN